MIPEKLKGISAGLLASSIWGGMFVVSKVLLDVIPPFALLTGRLVLGILVLGAVLALRRGLSMTRQQMWQVLGVGVIGYGVSIGLQNIGTKLSTAANGSLVTMAAPLFVFLFGWWLLGEAISPRRLAALLVATVGVIAVIQPGGAQLAEDHFWGNISLLAAAVTWALYSVLIRKVTRELDTLPVSFVALCGGLLVTVPAGAWELSRQDIGEITGWMVAGMLYLGIISMAIASFLWNKSFELLEAGTASLTLFAQPLVGAFLGTLYLGEQVSPLFVVGGGLIALGLGLAAGEKT